MKNITSLALCLLVLGSCATQKRCWNNWPPEIRTDTVIHTEIEYRDTTVYVYIPHERTVDEVPVYIIDTVIVEGKARPVSITLDSARAKTEYAEAVAWVKNSILELELTQKDSLISITLDSVIAIKDHYVELYTTEIHKAPPEKKCPTRSVILYLLGGFFLGVVLVFIIKMKK